MTLFDLTGRVALVTGGNGGIGLGMAKGMADAGASVMVAGRNKEKSAAAAKACGAKAASVEVDVTKADEVEAMVKATVDRFGAIDILVINAGINIRKPAHEASFEEWHAVLSANLDAAFLTAKAAYPALKTSGRGKVITTGSMTSLFGAAFAPAYSASKGGIVQFTRSIAAAWAPDNIQCNAILPGWIDTDLTRQARKDVPGLNERVLARTPAGRWGSGEDFAGIAVFLASSASDFVTGTAIPVDGGYSSTI
ncbi:SDR family NAD(P)-dependent oxidoreductase [Elioraea rosea]|uniref:SDR family NAD(P)-dependent oxidoreductase n=1 Tax=Elioraea rosea TaxID=2492390 RepID=UPI00118358C4|nr:glucose 1-dehydrogenase [Elioraea rosea]